MTKIRVSFAWYDLWVGFFWDKRKRILYICPIPMLLIAIGSLPKKLPPIPKGYSRKWCPCGKHFLDEALPPRPTIPPKPPPLPTRP